MDALDRIAGWITENEALFSGLAALIAIAAIVPALLRPLWRRRREASDPARAAAAARGPEATPRIAVLPFASASGAPEERTEAEILQQEVTTLLARSVGCEVISSWAASSYATAGGGSAEAGRELDVRYVVEGQVRSTPGGCRVTAHLVDTGDARVVWSDAFEASADETADLPAQLAERIASHLGTEIVRAEVGRVKRRPRSRAARDLMLQAQGILFAEGHHKRTYERAIGLLEQATARDADFAEAYGMLALLYALGECFGFFEHSDAFREKVFGICRRALELDDRTSEVLGYVGCAYCDLRQHEQGLPLLERAVSLNPSNAQARAALGTAYHGLGRFEDSVGAIEGALHISPAHKGIAPWATVLAGSYLYLGAGDEASATIDRALHCDPNFFPAHLIAALVALGAGDAAAARRHVDEARRINPELSEETLGFVVGQAGARAIGSLTAGTPA